jgi:hypothetical protein
VAGQVYGPRDVRHPGDSDWSGVVEALNALGDAILRATNATADEDVNRRRLRELADGLASLARLVGGTEPVAMSVPLPTPAVPAVPYQPLVSPLLPPEPVFVSEELRPQLLTALAAVNAKFQEQVPFEDAGTATAPPEGVPVAFVAAPAPAGADEPLAATQSWSVVEPAAAPAIPADRIDAVKAVRDRFAAERAAAEQEAAAHSAATAALMTSLAMSPADEPAAPEEPPADEPAAPEEPPAAGQGTPS